MAIVEPLVSVVIPSYNCCEYICEAVDSILAQSYKNIEIIVVDSSTDDTKQRMDRYDTRVRYYYQEPKGVSAARNFGLKQAQGALVAFQDADDHWGPSKLALQVQALREYPDAKLVFSDFVTFDDSGVLLSSACFPHFKLWVDQHRVQGGRMAYGQLYWELMLGNCIGTCSVLAVKDALDEYNGFDEAFKTCEDLDLWLRVSTKYPVLYIDEVLAEYRVRSTGLSGSLETRDMTWAVDRARVREKHLRNNLVPNHLRPQVEQLQGRHCWQLGWACLNGGDRRKARAMFRAGLRYRSNDWRMWLYFGLTFFPSSMVELGKRAKSAFRAAPLPGQ